MMIVSAFAVAILIALPTHAFAEKTLGLSSGVFKFDVEAGESVTGTIYATNDGDEDISVLMYVSDQMVDDEGGIAYETPDRTDFAALTKPATWTSLRYEGGGKTLGNIPYIELKPGERRAIHFAIETPVGTAPGDHNLLVFFEMFEQPEGGESKALVSGRIGARVTLRVEGTLVERIEVRPFEVQGFVIGNAVPFSFLLRNMGNTDRRVTADTLLLKSNGTEVGKGQPVGAQLVFAQRNREASGTLVAQGSPLGKYTVRLDVVPVDDEGQILDAGRDRVSIERTVWFVPVWLVAAAALFLVLLFGRAMVVFMGKRARRRAEDDAAAARRRAEIEEYQHDDSES